MKQAIIDIGSNSMRLTLYEIQNQNFKILFREKVMTGLAGYVEDGKLCAEGIECACAGLLKFQNVLKTLAIENVAVFATASLRNISNTKEALSAIQSSTGYEVEVISGEDEALFGYAGAMQQFQLRSGAFMDIGGASTEVVTFEEGKPIDIKSFPVGSLSLYRRCVKKVLPGEGSLKRLHQEINNVIDVEKEKIIPRAQIVGVGGTARAVLKLTRRYYHLDEMCNTITAKQLDGLCEFLCSGKKEAIDLILRLEADRIHTLIPGLLVLRHVFKLFEAEQLIVSQYGVREGYLCERILKDNINTPKTAN